MKYKIRVDHSLSNRISILCPYPYQIQFYKWGQWHDKSRCGFNELDKAKEKLKECG